MELTKGQVAVVTGAGSGIGLALAERFATAGMNVVLADVQEDALWAAAERIESLGVEALAAPTDVSDADAVQSLAAATIERFGAVHVVCNNAGVASSGGSDPWFGPIDAWEWVMGVNMWGVVHGCRAFLPHLLDGGHIVNTASVAGLLPGLSPVYDATKHAVVAITENLYLTMQTAGLPIGVSVLCPGWVRTNILDAERNRPGGPVARDAASEVIQGHMSRVISEGLPPARVADAVFDAISTDTYWVLPMQDEFLDRCVERWATIADRINPTALDIPGLPPREEIVAEVLRALEADSAPS